MRDNRNAGLIACKIINFYGVALHQRVIIVLLGLLISSCGTTSQTYNPDNIEPANLAKIEIPKSKVGSPSASIYSVQNTSRDTLFRPQSQTHRIGSLYLPAGSYRLIVACRGFRGTASFQAVPKALVTLRPKQQVKLECMSLPDNPSRVGLAITEIK